MTGPCRERFCHPQQHYPRAHCTFGNQSGYAQTMAVVSRIYHGAPETRNCLVTASLFKYTLWGLHVWNLLTALFSDVSLLSDAWLDYFLFIFFYFISRCCLEHTPQSSISSGNTSPDTEHFHLPFKSAILLWFLHLFLITRNFLVQAHIYRLPSIVQ